MNGCPHHDVYRYGIAKEGHGLWKCRECGDEFVPAFRLQASEKKAEDATGLLKAFLIAMRAGASTEEILATVCDGAGILDPVVEKQPQLTVRLTNEEWDELEANRIKRESE